MIGTKRSAEAAGVEQTEVCPRGSGVFPVQRSHTVRSGGALGSNDTGLSSD